TVKPNQILSNNIQLSGRTEVQFSYLAAPSTRVVPRAQNQLLVASRKWSRGVVSHCLKIPHGLSAEEIVVANDVLDRNINVFDLPRSVGSSPEAIAAMVQDHAWMP